MSGYVFREPRVDICVRNAVPKQRERLRERVKKGQGQIVFSKAFVLMTWMASVLFSNLMCNIVFVA